MPQCKLTHYLAATLGAAAQRNVSIGGASGAPQMLVHRYLLVVQGDPSVHPDQRHRPVA